MNKVLIVEDEDIIRKGLMFTVNWQDVDAVVVGEAANGAEGLQKIKELRPDIVLVDINMPVKNGLEMLEESMAEYAYQAIIISGYSEFEYAKKAMSIGVTEYLLKPVNHAELYESVRKLNQRKRDRNSLNVKKRRIDEEMKRLGILEEVKEHSDKYVQGMLTNVREKYADRISLTDISEEYGVSCTYLNGKFKEVTGYTFNDYLNRYRISKAMDLLKTEDMKVYEIAERVGFSDYKYFIKVFKKYAGHPPAVFIKVVHNKLL